MQEKVIFITGGAKRVGAAISQELHARGANLVIHYRSSINEAEQLQSTLNKRRSGSVKLIYAELLNVNQLSGVVDQAAKEFGRMDALINNASSFFPTRLGECTTKAWDNLIGSNLMAPLFLSQAAASYLKPRQGSIINIVDIHADRPLKNYIIYNVAKGGLVSLTKSLALELAPEIRVNGVAPGPILWPENGEWHDDSVRQEIIGQTLLKRMGEPEDIARTVGFLVADAPYVTGQIIAVDGGRSINL